MKKFNFGKVAGRQPTYLQKNDLIQSYFSRI